MSLAKVKLFDDCFVDRTKGKNWRVYRSYKKAVKRRNHNKCVKCDSFRDLQLHHIKNYAEFPELRLDLNNSVPLCESCHTTFHYLYGYNGNGRRQLREYLGNKKWKRCRIFD